MVFGFCAMALMAAGLAMSKVAYRYSTVRTVLVLVLIPSLYGRAGLTSTGTVPVG
jgi:hypothetical protein